jgi:SAM-dependent methyltransferase
VALKQHLDVQVRFDQQVDNSLSYVLPFIEKTKAIGNGTTVLEIGCAEGGVLKPFVDRGCQCVGVDLDPPRVEMAKDFLAADVAAGKIEFICQNVYDADFLQRFKGHFDLLILKDSIEHIPEQEKFIPYITQFLKQGGQIFFGFPPWYMPFGGHQQVLQGKLASKLPYYHILPRALYKGLLKLMGEEDAWIQNMMEVYDTRISIERFERIIRKSGLKTYNKRHYLINPIYKYKFGLEPREQWGPITHIPFFRNFVTTCVYYTVGF